MFRKPVREFIFQDFYPIALTVPVWPDRNALSLVTQSGGAIQYDAFSVSVPGATSAVPVTRSVYMGNNSINPPGSAGGFNGIELVPGLLYQFGINNERPLYEVQQPLIEKLGCSVPESIPLIVWPVTNIFFTTVTAPAVIGIILFKCAKL
jgi:hypothetical protein